MALYRSEGILHCPTCFAMQEFVPVEWAASSDLYPPCECSVCGFVFDESVDEKTGERRPTLSREVRDAARQKLRDRQKYSLVRLGYRLENFKQQKATADG